MSIENRGADETYWENWITDIHDWPLLGVKISILLTKNLSTSGNVVSPRQHIRSRRNASGAPTAEEETFERCQPPSHWLMEDVTKQGTGNVAEFETNARPVCERTWAWWGGVALIIDCLFLLWSKLCLVTKKKKKAKIFNLHSHIIIQWQWDERNTGT